jgi:Protein of unknown function (DUF1153)
MYMLDTTYDLPPPNTNRWTAKRKLAVLEAIKTGTISLEEAGSRYALSEEELDSWSRMAGLFGPLGLRTTKLQEYRGESEI